MCNVILLSLFFHFMSFMMEIKHPFSGHITVMLFFLIENVQFPSPPPHVKSSNKEVWIL